MVQLSDGKTYQVNYVHSSPFDENFLNLGVDSNYLCRRQKNAKSTALRDRVDALAEKTQRRITYCQLAQVDQTSPNSSDATGHVDTFVVLGEGFSVCHPNDNFNKAKGRKIALTNAIDASGLDYNARAEFWNVYRTTIDNF